MAYPESIVRLAITVLTVGFCAAATGCAGGGKATPTGGTPTANRASSVSAAPAGLHGIVAVQASDGSTPGSALDVFDPRTGHLTRSLSIGWDVGTDTAFSTDWRLVASATVGITSTHGMTLGRLAGDSYVQIGSWTPQDSLTQGRQQYSAPVFNRADGRLWFAQRELGQAQPADSDVWFSVDPGQPTGAPRQEPHGPPVLDPAGRVVQPRQVKLGVRQASPDTVATVTTSSTGLLSATVEGGGWPSAGPWGNGFLFYECHQHVSAEELLCVAKVEEQDAAGAVVGLSVPAQGGKAVLRQIFPPASSGVQIEGGYLSPDRTSVLLATQADWFLGPVTGSSAPVPAFGGLDRSTLTILGWY